MATRLMVTLTQDEADALAHIAYAELRDPRDQLRLLLQKAARERGLLPPDQIKQIRNPSLPVKDSNKEQAASGS